MHIDSTRFGRFEVEDDLLLTFPDGLIGLPGNRYVLVAQSETAPFYWLHSVDHAQVALPVTNPWLFTSDYEVRMPEEDARRLGLATPGVSGAPTRVALGVRLRLLEPTLAGQILAAGRLAGEFLGLTHDLADDPAGSPLGALMLSQTASPSGCSRYSPTQGFES